MCHTMSQYVVMCVHTYVCVTMSLLHSVCICACVVCVPASVTRVRGGNVCVHVCV